MKANMTSMVVSALVLVLAAFAGTASASYRYGDDYRGNGYDRVVRCDSRSGRTHHCRMQTSGGVRIIERYSGSGCVRGRSWGWVDGGCRAEFLVFN